MRNEERRIGPCLDSILRGDFPIENAEILVVDGDSADRSREIVRDRMSQCAAIRLLRNEKKHVPAGLNQAIGEARGRYLLRMDAHCEYPADYVSTCVAELERTGAANVGGLLETLPGRENWLCRCIALVTQHPVGVGNSAFRLGQGDRYVDTVPFGAFRKDVIDEVGGFREKLVRNQDYELNARIRARGYKIYLSSRIRNKYYNSSSFEKFMQQAFSNGYWGAICWASYPESFSLRHAAPFLFLALQIALFGAGTFSRLPLLAGCAVEAIYCGALLVAAIQIAAANNWRHLFLTPVLIASYHFCYGVGTVCGGFELLSEWLSCTRLNRSASEGLSR